MGKKELSKIKAIVGNRNGLVVLLFKLFEKLPFCLMYAFLLLNSELTTGQNVPN